MKKHAKFEDEPGKSGNLDYDRNDSRSSMGSSHVE